MTGRYQVLDSSTRRRHAVRDIVGAYSPQYGSTVHCGLSLAKTAEVVDPMEEADGQYYYSNSAGYPLPQLLPMQSAMSDS